MSDTSPILSLPFIQPAQAQKHVTHNEALQVLDAVVQLAVLSADLGTPPDSPQIGDCYIVAQPAGGDWTGHSGELAVFGDGYWRFFVPQAGWSAQVLTPKSRRVYDPVVGWEIPVEASAQTTPQLGINTVADTVNRLSVSSPATLLNHEGAGHQLKLNKAAVADTASLLYQTGFSGRAEMGLAGDDAFAVKVSADGSTWKEALRVDPASARVTLNAPLSGLAVTQGASDMTADRVIRSQDGYVKGSLLGAVSQVAGVPTGAVIERGTNANGNYVRFADGTQICDAVLTATYNLAERLRVQWTFPVPFEEMPNCNGMLWVGKLAAEVTPPVSDITGVMRGASTGTVCDFMVYRVTGGTNFAPTDTTPIQVTAIGRWF